MTARLTVDLGSAVPVYEQLRAQIAGNIGSGALRTGERLPTVRGLAAELGIAVNTVGRAYAELESAGLIRSGRRAGTTVIGSTSPVVDPAVIQAARAFTAAAATAGLTEDTAVALLRHAWRQQPPPG